MVTAAETWLPYTIRMTDIKETQETRPIMPGTEDSDRPLVELTHVEKHYGDLHVLKDINLTVKKGEVLVIVGPSGSGKSTMCRTINRLETIDSGDIRIDGKPLPQEGKELASLRAEVGMVFQSFNLFANKTILENVTLAPIKVRHMDKKAAEDLAMDLLSRVGVASQASKMPSQLSGGQQQRVAIARALANEPKVLLLDEPLSALDLKLRKDMQNELKKIQQAIGITFIFVTHDQEEALSMSDTVVVMDKGEIQQIGSPIDIYNEPKNAFVADFIGESNILDGTMIEDYLVEVAGQRFKSLDSGFGKMAPVDVVIRPEDIDIVPTGSAAAHINGVVTSVTFKGVHYEIIVDVDGFKWMIQTTDSANVGDKIGLALTPDDIHVMAKSVYSGTMGDYSTFSDEMEEALQEEGSEHED